MNRICKGGIGRLAVAGLFLVLVNEAFPAGPAGDGINDAKKSDQAVDRDPFWPVGFVPEQERQEVRKKAPAAPVEGEGWQQAMGQVVINGVSSRADNDFFAVINGEVKTVGETVEVNYGGRTYVWAVESIKPPGSVKLRRQSVR